MREKLRVLIVDDDQMMAKTLSDIFKFKSYEAETAHSGKEALKKLENHRFDCVISDIKMPDLNGVELYKIIRERRYELPVMLMTAYSSDTLVKEGLKEGVISVLSKPIDIKILLDFLSSLKKERNIVLVDDDPDFCASIGKTLALEGFNVIEITDPHCVLEKINENTEVVILDMKLNNIDGLDIFKEIRDIYRDLTVILITGYREFMESKIETALEIGAHTCFYKPFEINELLEIINRLYYNRLGEFLKRCSS